MEYKSFLLISSSDTINYEEYNKISLDRIERYKNITNFRMTYFDGGFRHPLDILNKCIFDKYYLESYETEKKEMYNIWNLTTANGPLAVNLLMEAGIDCDIISNFDNNIECISNYLSKANHPVIGISTTFILNWSEIGRISKKIKHLSDKVKIVLGGAFVSSNFIANGYDFFYKAMKKYNIDYVLTSPNSEWDLPILFSALNKDVPIETVSNLLYMDSQKEILFTNTMQNEPIVALRDRAMEAAIHFVYKKTLQLRTSVGCPFSCKFCSYSSMSQYIREDLTELEHLLDMAYQSGNIENIIFIDDNLNLSSTRFNALLDILLKFNFKWYGFIRVQFIDEAIANKMKKSGCDGVYLGLESGSDLILDLMNKKTDVTKYVKGMNAFKNVGINTFASFIVGLPGETEETINETIDFINNKVSCDYYSLKEYYYDHNSPIFKEADSYGLTGNGNRWSHQTMTSYDATVFKEFIYNKINNSIHIDPDLGMWYLVYLRINGYSWDNISFIQKQLNKLLDYDLQDDLFSSEKEKIFTTIKSYLKIHYIAN